MKLKISVKALLKALLNSLLGLILIVIWWNLVDVEKVINVLKTADYSFVLTFTLFYFVSTLIRSLRLKILLNSSELKLKELTLLNMSSQFLSFIIPVRAGEIVKGVYLKQRISGISLGQSLIWSLMDRFFDFWVVLLVVTVTGFMIDQTNISLGAGLALAGFTCASIITILSQPLAVAIAKKFAGPLKSFCLSVIEGFDLLKMPAQRWGVVLFLSLMALVSDTIIWLSALWAVGINLNFLQGPFATGLSALSFLIPAAPGFVGSAEASGLVILSYILGFDKDLASSGIVLNHILTFIILPIFGLIAIPQLKIKWKTIRP